MASAVVRLDGRRPADDAPHIRLKRDAGGFGFVVSFAANDREDSFQDHGSYDEALADAQAKADRHKVALRDETGVSVKAKPNRRGQAVAAARKAVLSYEHQRTLVENLPDMFDRFDLPDLPDGITGKIDFELLEMHTAERFKMMRTRALEELDERHGDTRDEPRAFTQKVHDQNQAQMRLLFENMMVKQAVTYGFLEAAFARIAELEAKAWDYQGVFKAGQSYAPGACCTWGGSLWRCNEATSEKPGDSRDGRPWQMVLKKGRDGKDARNAA